MDITAAMVKELRERTGAGMMECKKALTAAGGDMETAIEQMRVSGAAKADKKSDNTAAEGVVSIRISDDGSRYAMVEVNSQTDFASKSEDFTGFVSDVNELLLNDMPADTDALSAMTMGGNTVEETRKNLIAKIGENIQVRRFDARQSQGGTLGSYSHSGRIGVVCELQGGDETLARDIAMHIAASKPLCVNPEDIDADVLAKEKAIFSAEAAESGKPPEIVEKMVEGKVHKYLAEVTLVGQPYVKDTEQTVAKLLQGAGASVTSFVRLEVGEGIEKKVENFAEEVMAQVRGS